MSSTRSTSSRTGYALTLVLLTSGFLLPGCATSSPHGNRTEPPTAPPLTATQTIEPIPVPVVRYSRYTLVEISPKEEQADLLQQIVDVTMPSALTSTVGDSLRYVLLRSGYQLCDGDESRPFETFPLPAAHLHLGPMTLRNVLQLLVGPAWVLEVDNLTRRICFRRNLVQPSDFKAVPPDADPPGADRVGTAPAPQPSRQIWSKQP
jgi:conjugative transfer region protein (TIGR03748 family)